MAADLAEKLDSRALALLSAEYERNRKRHAEPEPSERKRETAASVLAAGPPGGFELASNDREAALRVARYAMAVSRAVAAQRSRNPPKKRRDLERRALIRYAGQAFEDAYGRRLGAGQRGPGARFLTEFLRALGIRASASTRARWIREAR